MNVVAVGDEICRVLEENGIKTVHDTTYHDYPSYQGSYTRALSTIETQLKNNPTIEIVLDVHRDAFIFRTAQNLRLRVRKRNIDRTGYACCRYEQYGIVARKLAGEFEVLRLKFKSG